MQHMPLIKFMWPSQALIIKNYLCKISDRKYLQLATGNLQPATSKLQLATGDAWLDKPNGNINNISNINNCNGSNKSLA